MAPIDKNSHLFILSLDALNAQDFDFLTTLPNFKSFIEEGSYVREVESVYPSVTYTCHSSIITGVFPDKHGIYANERIHPERALDQPWNWYEKYIQVPTLFDYANEAGLVTANVLWPVMADAPIRYNCPEIWSVVGESYISLYLKHASKRALPIIFKNASKSKGKEQPYLDNFVESIVLDLIAKKKPNLLTAHLIELDHERHVSGLHEPVTYDILRRLDQRVGRILEAAKKAGIYDKTDFVLLGDHGGTNFTHVVYMNTLFEEAGFVQIDQNRLITSWKVYANSCGGSTHIHFHPTCDPASKEKIIQLLHTLSAKPDSFIKHLYTKAEVQQKYHLSGDFEYVIEPMDGFIFHGEVAERGVIARNEVANCFVADHGHEPTHPDLKTILFAKGPRIQKGVILEKACIVDEGPTFAAILGLEMKTVDGSILNALIKKF